jgi:hypothetical protein
MSRRDEIRTRGKILCPGGSPDKASNDTTDSEAKD